MPPLSYQRIDPPSALQDRVHYFWHMRSDGQPQAQPDLLIPDGYAEVIFVLAGAYQKRVIAADSPLERVDRSVAIGLQTQSLLVRRQGAVELFGVKFHPLPFYEKWGPITGQTLDFGLWGGPDWAAQESLLRQQPRPVDLVQSLGQWLQVVLPPVEAPSLAWTLTAELYEAIRQTRGQVPVQELMARLGRSQRSIERYFRRYLGLTPKALARIMRFKATYKQFVLKSSAANHYLDFGYYDQSHFIRDFHAYTGASPQRTKGLLDPRNDIARRSLGER